MRLCAQLDCKATDEIPKTKLKNNARDNQGEAASKK